MNSVQASQEVRALNEYSLLSKSEENFEEADNRQEEDEDQCPAGSRPSSSGSSASTAKSSSNEPKVDNINEQTKNLNSELGRFQHFLSMAKILHQFKTCNSF